MGSFPGGSAIPWPPGACFWMGGALLSVHLLGGGRSRAAARGGPEAISGISARGIRLGRGGPCGRIRAILSWIEGCCVDRSTGGREIYALAQAGRSHVHRGVVRPVTARWKMRAPGAGYPGAPGRGPDRIGAVPGAKRARRKVSVRPMVREEIGSVITVVKSLSIFPNFRIGSYPDIAMPDPLWGIA